MRCPLAYVPPNLDKYRSCAKPGTTERPEFVMVLPAAMGRRGTGVREYWYEFGYAYRYIESWVYNVLLLWLHVSGRLESVQGSLDKRAGSG